MYMISAIRIMISIIRMIPLTHFWLCTILLFNVLSTRYAKLLDLAKQRCENVQESCRAYQLVREAADLASWITEKENMMTAEEVGDDLEQVEELQKKFDEFQKVRPAKYSLKNFYIYYLLLCHGLGFHDTHMLM